MQAFIVRMLHDPVFRAAVYAGPVAGLDEPDRTLLTAIDPRAWTVDRERRERVLGALVEELPVATLAVLEHVVWARLPRFFETPFFHDAVMAGGSLALAFAGFLAALAPRATPFITLERAIATLRRARPTPLSDGLVARADHVLSLALPTGTLAAWHAAKTKLATPLPVLLQKKRPALGRVDQRTREWVLLERGDDVSVGFIGEALGRLLAATPATHAQLVAIALEEGATADEAEEIVGELIADRILTRAGPGTTP